MGPINDPDAVGATPTGSSSKTDPPPLSLRSLSVYPPIYPSPLAAREAFLIASQGRRFFRYNARRLGVVSFPSLYVSSPRFSPRFSPRAATSPRDGPLDNGRFQRVATRARIPAVVSIRLGDLFHGYAEFSVSVCPLGRYTVHASARRGYGPTVRASILLGKGPFSSRRASLLLAVVL